MSSPEYVFGFFGMAFYAVFSWFFQILTASGAAGLYLAVFAIFCVVRFLIVPIIGTRKNDDVGDN